MGLSPKECIFLFACHKAKEIAGYPRDFLLSCGFSPACAKGLWRRRADWKWILADNECFAIRTIDMANQGWHIIFRCVGNKLSERVFS